MVIATSRGTLGTILMLELREQIKIPHDAFLARWTALGLPEGAAPKPRNRRDAYRRAIPNRKWAKSLHCVPYTGRAKPKEWDMASILTRSRDAKTKVALTHANRGVVALRKDGRLEVLPPANVTRDEQEFLDHIAQQFRERSEFFDGDLIRGAIGRVLDSSHAISLRGGVSMVPATHEETTAAVVELVKWLDRWAPFPNTVFTVAYEDGEGQRAQLRDAIRRHVEGEIDQRFVEIDGYLRRNGAAGERYKANMVGEILHLGALIGEFETVLEESLSEMHTYLGIQQALLQQTLA